MNWADQCAVVIPCLNEAATIAGLVRAVRAHLPAVMVVDDGSTDPTGPCAAQAGAEVLRNELPQGKGAALTRGWQRARERGFSWVMSMDGDGQHAAADIPSFLALAERDQASLIVGNRMDCPRGMPWLRRQVNRWMSRRLSRLAGACWPDTQCGFRLMRLGAWSTLSLQTAHFEFDSELLLRFQQAGEKIAFVPVQVIYGKENSKISPLRDTWRWFWWLRHR